MKHGTLTLCLGLLLLAASCAAPGEDIAPAAVQMPQEAPRPIPEPEEPMGPLEPGVHILQLDAGQVPVLVAREETSDLEELNRQIAELTEGDVFLSAYPRRAEGFIQAVVLCRRGDGTADAHSFVYDVQAGQTVSLTQALEQHGVDVGELFPRYAAHLREERGAELLGLKAVAFCYAGDSGIEVVLSARERDGSGVEGDGFCVYRTATDTFRPWKPGQAPLGA